MLPVFNHATIIGLKTKVRIVSVLVLFIPVYFFGIGDGYGSGFQTSIFRYQEIFLGSFLVFISNDLYNVMTGFFQGSMVPAVILWCLGSFALMVNTVTVFVGTRQFNSIIKSSGLLIMVSGIFFLLSILVHYGLLFHNSSGTAIPVGLLLIFLLGIWVYQLKDNQEDIDKPVNGHEGILE